MDDKLLYAASVYDAFHGQPEKFEEFLKFARVATANGTNEASAIARMTQLMEGHPKLLLGLSVFLEAERTIPPEADQTERELLESYAHNFLNNVKTRFKTVDTHVYMSVLWELNMYKDRKKSLKEVQEEVVDLLYYHEDLIEEFFKTLPKM